MLELNSEHIPAVVALSVVCITAFVLAIRKRHTTTVTDLVIYPVKSCHGCKMHSANATVRGFENDRIAQVTDKNGKYCTPRDIDKTRLFHIEPKMAGSKIILTSQDAAEPFELDLLGKTKPSLAEPMTGPKVTLRDYGDSVAAWFEKNTGIKGARLTGIGEGYDRAVEVNPDQGDAVPTSNGCKSAPVSLADEAPYLLASTSSLRDLNRRLVARGKSQIDMRRFRPNIVISGLKPWEEDSLSKIRIGQVEFWAWQRCGRCAMTTIDRGSLDRGPEPLATLSTFRERANGQRNFGMHLVPVAPIVDGGNKICVGDKMEILEYDEERKSEWERLFG